MVALLTTASKPNILTIMFTSHINRFPMETLQHARAEILSGTIGHGPLEVHLMHSSAID